MSWMPLCTSPVATFIAALRCRQRQVQRNVDSFTHGQDDNSTQRDSMSEVLAVFTVKTASFCCEVEGPGHKLSCLRGDQ